MQISTSKNSLDGTPSQPHYVWSFMVFLLLSTSAATAQVVPGCGDIANSRNNGPYDYTVAQDRAASLDILEKNHFNTDVQRGIGGQSSFWIMDDLDYVLRTFPNHHPALFTMMRHKLSDFQVNGPQYFSADCYFKRALKLRPDDGVVRMIYGIYFSKVDEKERAVEQFAMAYEVMPNNAEVNYNLGLVYLEMKELEKANFHAVKAYQLGFPLPGLKRKLKEAGGWNPDVANAKEKNS